MVLPVGRLVGLFVYFVESDSILNPTLLKEQDFRMPAKKLA